VAIKKNETPEEREKRLQYNRDWNKNHRNEENKKRMVRYYGYQRKSQLTEYLIHRLKVLERMGSKCVFCGQTDESILAVDHINNDGSKERKTLGTNIYHRLFFMEEIPKDKYQLLCCACNHKKRRFGDDFLKWPIRTVQEYLKILDADL
jgi:hypothetical protein